MPPADVVSALTLSVACRRAQFLQQKHSFWGISQRMGEQHEEFHNPVRHCAVRVCTRVRVACKASYARAAGCARRDLSGNALASTIPDSFGNLTSLQQLCVLTFWRCHVLTHVDAALFCEPLPPACGVSNSLLYSNSLTGSIPSMIGGMRSLIYVCVSVQQMTLSLVLLAVATRLTYPSDCPGATGRWRPTRCKERCQPVCQAVPICNICTCRHPKRKRRFSLTCTASARLLLTESN
jgi:hypothetical protein